MRASVRVLAVRQTVLATHREAPATGSTWLLRLRRLARAVTWDRAQSSDRESVTSVHLELRAGPPLLALARNFKFKLS